MKLRVHHRTRYTYTEPLRHSVQSLHLWPATGPWQTVLHWSLKSPAQLHARVDGLGNHVHHGSFTPAKGQPDVLSLDVVASGVVDTLDVPMWCDAPGLPPPSLFLRSTALVEPHPRLAQWGTEVLQAAGWVPAGADADAARSALAVARIDTTLALAQAVQNKVRYRTGSTVVNTTALEAFDWGLGVCQDQAQVMVAVCRSLGWPARYVSGYFYAPDEPELASHAWVEVCVDVARREWLSVDITHSCLTDERHIRLAAGTDYSTCPPIKGVRQGGGVESMQVDITIVE